MISFEKAAEMSAAHAQQPSEKSALHALSRAGGIHKDGRYAVLPQPTKLLPLLLSPLVEFGGVRRLGPRGPPGDESKLSPSGYI